MNIKERKTKPSNTRTFDVWVDGELFIVEVGENGVPVLPNHPEIVLPETKHEIKVVQQKRTEHEVIQSPEGTKILIAPIPGLVHELPYKPGDTVKAGQTLVVLEAMKMYNELPAPCNLKVVEYPNSVGTNVSKDAVLCVFEIL